jgi:hypothetical protein
MRRIILLPALLVALAGAAFAGYTMLMRSPSEGADPVPVTPRPSESKDPDLEAMVLQRSQFGIDADGLRLDERASGVADNTERAEGTLDPDDTAGTLGEGGRKTGYDLSFLDTDLSSVLDGGTLEAGSFVDLYTSEATASAAILEQVVALELAESASADEATVVEHSSTFPVEGLDDALGFHVRLRIAGVSVWRTEVRFRHGSIVGMTAIARADDEDAQGRVVRLARALDRRIDGVLTGRIEPVTDGVKTPS